MPGTESRINPLSRTVVYLTLNLAFPDGGSVEMGTATGIIRTLNGLSYLVTAGHVLTGREADGRLKTTNPPYPPNKIVIEGYFSNWRCDLYAGSNNPVEDQARYWTHPLGPQIDVVVLPLGPSPKSYCSLDESFFQPVKNDASPIYVMQECYIVGFPYGLTDRTDPNLPLPIWKTGHIASEPLTDFRGTPRILIDGLTRPGQSGAPVFVGGVTWDGNFAVTRFVGIYAGRERMISPSGKEGEYWDLGYAFKPIAIQEIFSERLKK